MGVPLYTRCVGEETWLSGPEPQSAVGLRSLHRHHRVGEECPGVGEARHRANDRCNRWATGYFPTVPVFFRWHCFCWCGVRGGDASPYGMDTNKEHTHPSATPLLSLFSGYGGLDMGVAQALGPTRPVAVCDIEPGPTTILAAHWNTPQSGGHHPRRLAGHAPSGRGCGGSPCQSMSLAGLRAGMKHGTRSGVSQGRAIG